MWGNQENIWGKKSKLKFSGQTHTRWVTESHGLFRIEVTSTYDATVKKFTLGSYPTIFSGVTIYNVFALVISVLQWKIGSGGTLVGQICGEHARGKRPLPVGGWVAQTWVTSKCLLRLSSHTFSSPVLLHPFDEALIPVSQEKED